MPDACGCAQVGRFEKSDHIFYKIAAALLQAIHDVHIMTTHHIEEELDLDNFVLVGRGQRLLLAGVAWGDNFHGLHRYYGGQYEVIGASHKHKVCLCLFLFAYDALAQPSDCDASG